MNRDEITSWLLEKDNPPVRLLALTRLLGRSETDSEVQDARAHLMDYAVTQEILAHADAIWASGPRMFWSYKGKHWNTVYLGHFMADGHDPRIAPGIQRLLRERGWARPDCFQCMTACMLAAFRRLGYGDHPVVVEETEALAQRTLDNVGVDCTAMNPSLLSRCHMALPKLLLCFAEVPAEERSPAIQDAIDWIVEELLRYQVYTYMPGNRKAWQKQRVAARKDPARPDGVKVADWVAGAQTRFLAEHGLGGRVPKPSWTRFGFPLNYNSDILEAMYALATAGAPMSPALADPLQVIRDKRTADGTWRMAKSLNGQMWAEVEPKGEPSKWLTLFARIVLDHFEPPPP